MSSKERIADVTNKTGLPDPIVKAIANDKYDPGDADFTVTELLQPPRARALIKQHGDEIVEDAADKIWALCGQIGHLILERAGDPNIVEKRFYGRIGTCRISGQADLIMTGEAEACLFDYKFCSIWTTSDGIKPEWEQQVNMLACLAERNDIKITGADIVAIYRDWSKSRAKRERDYPPNQVRVFPVELWPKEDVERFIKIRIGLHKVAEKELPECSDEERWKDPPKWAVKKKGNKRAARVFDNESQAQAMMATDHKFEIEFRPSIAKRCEDYCLAFPFCTQAQSENLNGEPKASKTNVNYNRNTKDKTLT